MACKSSSICSVTIFLLSGYAFAEQQSRLVTMDRLHANYDLNENMIDEYYYYDGFGLKYKNDIEDEMLWKTRDLMPALGHSVFNDIASLADDTLRRICGAFFKSKTQIDSCIKECDDKKIIDNAKIERGVKQCRVWFKHRDELTGDLAEDRNEQEWAKIVGDVQTDVTSFAAKCLILNKYSKDPKKANQVLNKYNAYKREFNKLKATFKDIAEDKLKYNGDKPAWVDYPIGKVWFLNGDSTQKNQLKNVLKEIKKQIKSFPNRIAECVKKFGGDVFAL